MGLMINDTVDSDQLNYQTIAVGLIQDIVRERFRLADEPTPPFQVYIVWFNYTLGNWKALLSTTIEDSTYYEVTYNHRNGVAYVDSYKKFDNKTIAIPAARS